MVQDIFRDSTIGQAINYISSGRVFPYADQRPDFIVPPQFLHPSERKTALSAPESDAATICDDTDKSGKGISTPGTQLTREDTIAIDDAENLAEKQVDEALKSDPYTVGWYGDDDPENPRYAVLLLRSGLLFTFVPSVQKLVTEKACLCSIQY